MEAAMECPVQPDTFTPSDELPKLPTTGHVADDIDCAARAGITILISGGRDTATATARQVHDRRAARSEFVVVDCGRHEAPWRRLAEALRERSSSGRTVFLPDVDRLTQSQQSLVASCLRSGAARTTTGETVHIIASTSVDLFSRVRAGEFDKDLFYRLNTVHILVGR